MRPYFGQIFFAVHISKICSQQKFFQNEPWKRGRYDACLDQIIHAFVVKMLQQNFFEKKKF